MSDLVPDGWTKPRLKEVVTHFQNGYAFSAKGYIEQGIPIISMGSIQLDGQFKKVNSKLKFWDVNKKKELSRYLVKPNDLIMAMTDVTPTMELIGRSCIVKGKPEYFLNQRVGLISFKEAEISKEYFSYYTNFNEWRSYCIGSSGLGAQANLGTSQILDGLVSLPPLPEQQKIARILTSVDDVIEKTQAQIDKLKDLKTGMMQELLTNGNNGKPHTQFKDSPVGKIPAEWEVKALGDIYSKIVVGYVGSVNEYYCEKSEGIPFYRTLNIRDGYIRNTPVKYVTKAFNDKNKKSQIFNEDILIARVGANLGMTCKVTGVVGTANIANAIIIKSVKIASSDFFMEYIRSDMGQRQILAEAAGGAQGVFNTKLAQELMVPVPSLEEQIKICVKLGSLDNIIHVNELKLEKIKATKKALMQDLLTGKVRVKVEPTL